MLARVKVKGHFCDFTNIASSRRQMTGPPPYLHTMVRIRARIQDVLMVKVKRKGHMIRSPSTISVRQLDVVYIME